MDVIKRVSTAWRSITYEQTCYRLLDSDTQADSGAEGELIDIDSMTYVRHKPLQGSTLPISSGFSLSKYHHYRYRISSFGYTSTQGVETSDISEPSIPPKESTAMESLLPFV